MRELSKEGPEIEGLRAWSLHFTSSRDVAYHLNVRTIDPNNHVGGTALLLHGFGKDSTWLEWLAYAPALARSGMRVVLVDLPGFGRSTSSLRVCSPVHWRPDGAEIVSAVLDAFEAGSSVSVLAHCGGAATFLRCFVESPGRFGGRCHVIHNSVMSLGPQQNLGRGVEAALAGHGARIFATWAEDSEHPCCCAAYKWLTRASEDVASAVSLTDCEFESGLSAAQVFGRARQSPHFEAVVRMLSQGAAATVGATTTRKVGSARAARTRRFAMEERMRARRDHAELVRTRRRSGPRNFNPNEF